MTTPSPVRERRDMKALEARRKKAGRMFARGVSQAEVARQCGVSRTAVHYWHEAWKKKGEGGLAPSRPVFGRPSRLTEKNIERVKTAILAGPRESGFPTDLWTLARIAMVIKKKAKIAYHPNHVWRIIRSLGFTAQIPTTKPKERNEKAIAYWKTKVWPQIQKRGSNARPA